MAWQGLVERAQLSPGQRVFVNGCTGGVGEAVVQVARMLGAEVVGTCRADAAERARSLGVSQVFNYATTDVAGVAELRGAFDAVFDTAGTLPVKTAMRMLKKTGVFLDINATPAKFLHAALARRHKIFVCTPTTRILTDAAHAAVEGHIRMSVSETVALEDAVDLITRLENGQKIPGKGLIWVDANIGRS